MTGSFHLGSKNPPPSREGFFNFFEIVRQHRIVLSGVIGAVLIYLSRPTVGSLLAGLPFVLVGEAIRTWSSGYIRKNKALATDGPYAHTRNPLYLGSFGIGVGFVVMGNSVWVLVIFLSAFGLVYWGVIRSEEDYLARVFGARFEEYVRTVPRFLPRWTRSPYEAGGFDWALVWKHREYQAWAGIAGGVAILIVKILALT
ncbi:MAG TPA: isoprenylcysteine carboxylmethyltransferase family protein [Nitrospiria bacterium]|jgi:protein-S-isoprenylcysteine O-methyltransferase Ste14|nr:isoprenylcysteine carboxylmethyltransferase family protein [Nitrospiria bacterium]